MNKTLRMGVWAARASLALLPILAACGDSSELVESAAPPGNEVPASAAASVQAYTSFAQSLGADDRAEPLGVGMIVPPTSETDEPITPI